MKFPHTTLLQRLPLQLAGALAIALVLGTPTTAEAQSPVNLNTASAAELQRLPGVGPARAEAIVQYREQHGPFRTVDDITRVPGIGPATLNNLRPLATVGNGDDAPPAEQPVPAPGASPGASAPGGAAAPPGPAARPPAARALDDIDLDESPDAGDVDRPTDVASAPAPQAGAAPQATGDQINLNTASAADLQRLPGIGATRAAAIISDRDLNGPFRSVDDITRVSGVGPATLNNIRGLVTVGE